MKNIQLVILNLEFANFDFFTCAALNAGPA
jgi:hypothetical protein